MVYAKALGYVLEVHSSLVPLFGPPSSYAAVVRHIDVQDGPQRIQLGDYAREADAKKAAETWLVAQILALGFCPAEPTPASTLG